MDINILITGSLTAVAAICLARYHYEIHQEVKEGALETGRFPLFAARRALVQLVADGLMAEEDEVWDSNYRFVTVVLGERQLHLFRVLRSYMKYLVRAKNDAAFKNELDRRRALERAVAHRMPEFARVLDAIGNSTMAIVNAHTPQWQRAALIIASAILTMFSVGPRAAQDVARRTARPKKEDLRGYRLSDEFSDFHQAA